MSKSQVSGGQQEARKLVEEDATSEWFSSGYAISKLTRATVLHIGKFFILSVTIFGQKGERISRISEHLDTFAPLTQVCD